jgi:hypothetical protein
LQKEKFKVISDAKSTDNFIQDSVAAAVAAAASLLDSNALSTTPLFAESLG